MRHKRRIINAIIAGLVVTTVTGIALAAYMGESLSRRLVPEVRGGLEAYEEEDYEKAARHFEQGRTDLEEEQGKLWLDKGLAEARLEKMDEAKLSLSRAVGESKTSKEVRSDAHFALGNLALAQHHDLSAIQEYKQALRFWPENRDAAWNLSLARRNLYIDDCRIVEPPSLEVAAGQESQEISGEVFEEFRTEQEGALKGLKAQIGYGLDGTEPTDDLWLWSDAEYAGEAQEGGAERYAAKIKAKLVGRYDYAFRFKQPGGPWQICDLDGARTNGYTPEQAGDLLVIPPGDRCALMGPAWIIVEPGSRTELIQAAVASPTGLESVEVGFGPDGSDPTTEDQSWSWSTGASGGVTEEEIGSLPAGTTIYQGSLRPSSPGRYDYALRFRTVDAEDWVVCDLNGSDDGYNPQGAGDLVVREMPDEGCLLDRPPRTSAAPGQTTEPIRALVKFTQDTSITLEMGVGGDGTDPSGAEWTWTEATGADDAPLGWVAYEIGIDAPGEQGSFDFAARARVGGENAPWAVCDLDGSSGGYDPAMAGDLLVQESQSEGQEEQQDEQEEEQEDEQEDEQEQDEQEEEQDEQEQEQQEEEQQLPQDMESVLDALQQNERTFLPPARPRQVQQDW